MTAPLRFTVLGQPVGKARARTFVHRQSGKVCSMTPPKTKAYELLIANAFHAKYGAPAPVLGHVRVTIGAYFAAPKYLLKTHKGGADALEMIPHTKKPDADNVAKNIDALNGIAWLDDSQVSELTVRKRYSLTPRVEVTIEIEP